MLSLLHIEDIAVISQAEIAFGEGFNVLTGETGAGKSIVVDAIGAIIGGRTSRDLIRTGAKCARVTGVFGGLPALNWFEQYGIAPDENGELLVERVIHPDGKNTCRVNGHPVLVTQLRELGSQLLNIHGQHDGQQLLDEETHLESLDNFAHLAPQRETYAEAYEHVKDLRSQLKAVQMDEGEKARRMDTLQHQIGELERAQLRVGEEAELTAQREILRNAERITDAVDQAWQALTGGEMSDGAVALLTNAENALIQGGRYSTELSELAQKVSQLRYAADDVAELVRDARSGLEFYPGQLDDVEERLDLLHRLKRKYGADEEKMLAYLDRCQTELDNIQFSDERREKLEREVAQAVQVAQQEAEQLSKARQKAARELSQRIQQELSDLDMPRVRFEVEFGPVEGEDGLNEFGMDRVRGGHRSIRPGCHQGGPKAQPGGPGPPGAVRHPPAPDRRHGRRALLGGEGGAGWPHLHPGGAAGPATPSGRAGPPQRRRFHCHPAGRGGGAAAKGRGLETDTSITIHGGTHP